MTQTWDDFTIVDSIEDVAGRNPVELPESGAGALLGWAVGPRHCVGVRRHPTGKVTRVSTEDNATGAKATWHEVRSVDDWALLGEVIDEYLVAAGVPARPGMLSWYLVDTSIGDETELRVIVTSLVDSEDPPAVLGTMLREAPTRLTAPA